MFVSDELSVDIDEITKMCRTVRMDHCYTPLTSPTQKLPISTEALMAVLEADSEPIKVLQTVTPQPPKPIILTKSQNQKPILLKLNKSDVAKLPVVSNSNIKTIGAPNMANLVQTINRNFKNLTSQLPKKTLKIVTVTKPRASVNEVPKPVQKPLVQVLQVQKVQMPMQSPIAISSDEESGKMGSKIEIKTVEPVVENIPIVVSIKEPTPAPIESVPSKPSTESTPSLNEPTPIAKEPTPPPRESTPTPEELTPSLEQSPKAVKVTPSKSLDEDLSDISSEESDYEMDDDSDDLDFDAGRSKISKPRYKTFGSKRGLSAAIRARNKGKLFLFLIHYSFYITYAYYVANNSMHSTLEGLWFILCSLNFD